MLRLYETMRRDALYAVSSSADFPSIDGSCVVLLWEHPGIDHATAASGLRESFVQASCLPRGERHGLHEMPKRQLVHARTAADVLPALC
ncbi:hypothetical protein AB0G54_10650 [Streptomyces yokosukanensis]|uniref:hypothetical protein n=1 Tax=Streptomyces yokosukanensis TaxID=67386 RepID=UPI00341DDFD4